MFGFMYGFSKEGPLMPDEPSSTSLVGDILARTKQFIDQSGDVPDGFTLSVLNDIKMHAEGHQATVDAESTEWTRPYRQLIADVREIIVSHTDLATGSDAWHECVAQLLQTVALDYAHR
jgi:hypothetical protein